MRRPFTTVSSLDLCWIPASATCPGSFTAAAERGRGGLTYHHGATNRRVRAHEMRGPPSGKGGATLRRLRRTTPPCHGEQSCWSRRRPSFCRLVSSRLLGVRVVYRAHGGGALSLPRRKAKLIVMAGPHSSEHMLQDTERLGVAFASW